MAKAIVALIVPILSSVLLPLGITETTTFSGGLEILLTALFTALAVYFVPNRVK